MIIPLPNYILVEPIKDEVMEGGVYVPQDVNEKPMKGKVIACGDGIKKWIEAGVEVDSKWTVLDTHVCPVKKGETVIFKKWADQSIKEKGKEYLLVKFEDLIAKIE